MGQRGDGAQGRPCWYEFTSLQRRQGQCAQGPRSEWWDSTSRAEQLLSLLPFLENSVLVLNPT